ncbi:MAG TPA: FkbM family methyltransferase [Gemmatimonadetes bacterium]|nr:FkbM family methyltransferase [Gemmatimonadota bacterium]
MGAQVVALEPQPAVRRWLERIVGLREGVTVSGEAVGRETGTAQLAVSKCTPTLSTLAYEWRVKLPDANPTFRNVRWEETVEVPVTTLDVLIERYGVPRFCKIDVEGHEAEVLAGLSKPVPGISVEFVYGVLEVAVACVRRLEALGSYEFNAVRGEARVFVFDGWQTGERMIRWLADGAGGSSSGDVYARLVSSHHA